MGDGRHRAEAQAGQQDRGEVAGQEDHREPRREFAEKLEKVRQTGFVIKRLLTLGKLWLAGLSLGRVFNSRSGCLRSKELNVDQR